MSERLSLLRSIDVRVLDEQLVLFRICGPRDAATFLDALRSHYELDRPPRGPEDRAAAIHMALSMFDSVDVAHQLAARVPKLGRHIATVELQPTSASASRRPAARRTGPCGAVLPSSPNASQPLSPCPPTSSLDRER